jgi:signal transduction histidine kinase/CheY-like chemotaxis protein
MQLGSAPPAVLLLAAGTMAPILFHQLWLWQGRRTTSVHARVALVIATAMIYMLGVLIDRGASGPSGVVVGIRMQYAGLAFLPALLLRAISSFFEREVPWKTQRVLLALSAVLVLLVSFTPLVVKNELVVHHAFEGPDYASLEPGPLFVPYALCEVVIAVLAFRALRAFPVRAWSVRKVVISVFAVALAFAVNDALTTYGVWSSVQLFPFGATLLVWCFGYVANRRTVSEYADLEEAVASRTREARETEARLREAVESLRTGELRFRSLSDATSEGVLFHSDGRVSDANAAATRLFDRESGELVGRSLDALFEEPSSLAGLGNDAVELSAIGSAGTRFPVEASNRSVGAGDMKILTVRDISERKRNEARIILADRLASLGTLAAGAAHEINNPLTYVLAGIETLSERVGEGRLQKGKSVSVDREEALSLLGEMREGCDRVASIVQELRELSRGKDDDRVPVRVVEAFETAIRMTYSDIREKAKIVRDFQCEPRVLANPGRLGQVLINLLVNAAQAIPEGNSGNHVITVGVRDLSNGRIRLEVSDTGSGIPEALLPRIFDPFVTTKAVGQGTGLGLSICHNIVTSLGGTIDVESEEGRGTTFRIELDAAARMSLPPVRISTPTPTGSPFRLPLSPVPVIDTSEPSSFGVEPPTKGPVNVEESRSEASSVQPVAVPVEALRVLVIDDDPGVSRALARMLRDHKTTLADGGQPGIDLLLREDFDVVLCDLMMPDVSGMDVYEAVRTVRPDIASRIVFITGGAHTAEGRAFLERVPNPKLDKPIARADLQDLMRTRREALTVENRGS